MLTSDRGRIDGLLRHLATAPRPFLAQLHLLDSHGPTLHPARRHFSAGKRQSRPFEANFVDDAILGFDGYIEEVFAFLETSGELESTVIVVTSDHAASWSTITRMPLLVRFPRAEPTGSMAVNTQTIDVAPTVIDYLGIAPRVWLEGASILQPFLEPDRVFLSTGKTVNQVFAVQCQNWFALDLVTGALQKGRIADHTAPCPEEALLDADQVLERMMVSVKGSSQFEQPLFIAQRLGALREQPDPAGRRRLVEDVLSGRTGFQELDADTVLFRAHWDGWTRGAQPVGIVVRNPGAVGIAKRISVHSGSGAEFPLRFFLEDGEATHEFVFTKPGRIEIELGPVVGASERLFIVWAERAWTPGPQDRRSLGIKLSIAAAAKASRR